MLDDATMPYIFDKTTNYNVYISRVGQDPHGIMIPNDFKYPLEKVCIKDAYAEFNNWGVNQVTSTDWYTKPTSGKVYEK
jgi:LruC domain-containing protein